MHSVFYFGLCSKVKKFRFPSCGSGVNRLGGKRQTQNRREKAPIASKVACWGLSGQDGRSVLIAVCRRADRMPCKGAVSEWWRHMPLDQTRTMRICELLWGWLQTQQHTSHAAHLQNDLASEMQRGCRWLRFLSIFKKRTVGSSDLPHASTPTCSQKR